MYMLNKLYVSPFKLFIANQTNESCEINYRCIQVMPTALRNNGMTVLRNVFTFVHSSIKIKHKKLQKSTYCSQVFIS